MYALTCTIGQVHLLVYNIHDLSTGPIYHTNLSSAMDFVDKSYVVSFHSKIFTQHKEAIYNIEALQGVSVSRSLQYAYNAYIAYCKVWLLSAHGY